MHNSAQWVEFQKNQDSKQHQTILNNKNVDQNSNKHNNNLQQNRNNLNCNQNHSAVEQNNYFIKEIQKNKIVRTIRQNPFNAFDQERILQEKSKVSRSIYGRIVQKYNSKTNTIEKIYQANRHIIDEILQQQDANEIVPQIILLILNKHFLITKSFIYKYELDEFMLQKEMEQLIIDGLYGYKKMLLKTQSSQDQQISLQHFLLYLQQTIGMQNEYENFEDQKQLYYKLYKIVEFGTPMKLFENEYLHKVQQYQKDLEEEEQQHQKELE